MDANTDPNRLVFRRDDFMFSFLVSVAGFSGALGLLGLLASVALKTTPATMWLSAAYVGAAVLAVVLMSGFRAQHLFDLTRRVLLLEQRWLWVPTTRELAAFPSLVVGVSGRQRVRQRREYSRESFPVYVPVVVTDAGKIIPLKGGARGDAGFEEARATASSLAEKLGVRLHPPVARATLTATLPGPQIGYVPLEQERGGTLPMLLAAILVVLPAIYREIHGGF